MYPSSRLFSSSLHLARTFSSVSGVGILAFDFYIPPSYVTHSSLEEFDGVSSGRYTLGLGQDSLSFVTDREDAVSLMSTCLSRLLQGRTDIDLGALYVGTESTFDRSKSIKSYLTPVLRDVGVPTSSSLEGVDCVNACFGGTQALWDAAYWVESQVRNETSEFPCAVVVCGDCATYKEPNARPTSGAGAVALLIGPNAPLRLSLERKMFHFDHVYDFYKPDPACVYPYVEGHFSNECYLRSLDFCFSRGGFQLSESDFALFHSPYNKLVQKAVGFLQYCETDNVEELNRGGSIESALERRAQEQAYSDPALLDECRRMYSEVYDEKAAPGTTLPKQIGNSYTSSLYFSLISLLWDVPEAQIKGSNILMFSYGSGLASGMFGLEVADDIGGESDFSLHCLREGLRVDERLDRRVLHPAEEFAFWQDRNAEIFREGGLNLEPAGSVDVLEDGTYYLDGIDHLFRRTYVEKGVKE